MPGTYRYVRASGIRNLVKDNKKRCGSDFLHALDTFIYDTTMKCIRQFNGHKATLDATVANLILKAR